ncbi:PEP-utilizing enzyme [Mycobacterium antarcticum]|uniref:PEP-utilizing enzyme n=1 Tax=unclassified Mycolicibacterium TaxID=2636767 RepID=UPI0024E0C551|nr:MULTISPECIES: PEP-utilizing enzyme [unclassified Mycolicibacterium]
MMERGLFETERDFYFLTWEELLEHRKGGSNPRMTRWKIESRMRNFDAWDYKQVSMPKFLQRNAPRQVLSTTGAVDSEGRKILQGFGTSGDDITATARVIRNLKEVGRVDKGDIMITNSTDPGWTPVFAALSGVIVETGGLLSHSGCLAREYGFPAAHIEDSVNQIADGATITPTVPPAGSVSSTARSRTARSRRRPPSWKPPAEAAGKLKCLSLAPWECQQIPRGLTGQALRRFKDRSRTAPHSVERETVRGRIEGP